MKNTIRPAEFAAVTAVDVTLLLGCDAVKFGIVKARAVAIFRGWLVADVKCLCHLAAYSDARSDHSEVIESGL